MRRTAEVGLVGLLALAAAGFGIWGIGLGSGVVDPMLRFGAGDEVTYGHAASRMVSTGHWATAVFLDRILLNKPPLLMWTGAFAMRLFGISPTVLRLPVVLAGALCCLVLYLWMRHLQQPMSAALIAMVLLAGDPLFHILSRKFMTDIWLTCWIVMAMAVLGFDPELKRSGTPYIFGALCGAAIMTKSAAGLVPLIILAVYVFLSTRKLRTVLIACGVALLVAAPWHIFELLTHRHWLLTEYFGVQIIGQGLTGPAATSGGMKLWFYLQAIGLTDPVLAVLSILALPGLIAAWRAEDKTLAKLLTAWIAVTLICLMGFANRASAYCLPLIPALALLSARFTPLLRQRYAGWVACVLLLLGFGIKVQAADSIWGLDFQGTNVPSASALDSYRHLGRGNELMIVSPDDEYYSSVIDLPKVRYAFIVPTIDKTKTADFFYSLGIIELADEFCRPTQSEVFAQRLAAWHAPGVGSIATVVMPRSEAELADMIRSHPDSGYYLPDELQKLAGTRKVMRLAPGRFFLLAEESRPRPNGPPVPGTLITQ